MKSLLRTILGMLILAWATSPAFSAELTAIRRSAAAGSSRIVFDLTEPVSYEMTSTESSVEIRLDGTTPGVHLDLPRFGEDDSLTVTPTDDGAVIVSISETNKQVVKIFTLGGPNRLVLDFTGAITAAEKPAPSETASAEPPAPALLRSLNHSSTPFHLRLVLAFDRAVNYSVSTAEGSVIVTIPNAHTNLPELKKFKDDHASHVFISKSDDTLQLIMPIKYRIPIHHFALKHPDRLVIDLKKIFKEPERRSIAVGLDYVTIREGTRRGPVVKHLLRLDHDLFDVLPALARPDPQASGTEPHPWWAGIFGGGDEDPPEKVHHFARRKLSAIASENGAIAAINGGYFSSSGRPLGMLLLDGEIVAAPLHGRAALFFKSDRSYEIGHPGVDMGVLLSDGTMLPVDAVNKANSGSEIILYTKHFSRTEDDRRGIHIVARNNQIVEITAGDVHIPSDGFVVGIHGPMADILPAKIAVGDSIEPRYAMTPDRSDLRYILGGGPRLVADGRVAVTSQKEKFRKDVAQGRAARTAIAIMRDGSIALVAVDGLPKAKSNDSQRAIESIGITLHDLADWLKGQGAVDAMNLDGGSSTSMVINGRLINAPTLGGEKPISNALLVKAR